MGTINDLRASIKSRLAAILPTGWALASELAGVNTTCPRCDFMLLGTGGDGGQHEYFTLNVELHNNSPNAGPLDAACEAVKGNGAAASPTGLDNYRTASSTHGWHCHLENRGDQPTDEQQLRQRNLAFFISAFFY